MMFMRPSCQLRSRAMENVLRPLIVIGGSVVLTLLVGWARRPTAAQGRRTAPRDPAVGSAAPLPHAAAASCCSRRSCAGPTTSDWRPVEEHDAALGQSLTLVLIGATAWLVVRIAAAIVDSSYARYAASTATPPGSAGSAPR